MLHTVCHRLFAKVKGSKFALFCYIRPNAIVFLLSFYAEYSVALNKLIKSCHSLTTNGGAEILSAEC